MMVNLLIQPGGNYAFDLHLLWGGFSGELIWQRADLSTIRFSVGYSYYFNDAFDFRAPGM